MDLFYGKIVRLGWSVAISAVHIAECVLPSDRLLLLELMHGFIVLYLGVVDCHAEGN